MVIDLCLRKSFATLIGTSADCKSVAYVCRRQYGVRSSATTDVAGSIAPRTICAPMSRSSACLNERHICFMDVSVCGRPVVGCVKR